MLPINCLVLSLKTHELASIRFIELGGGGRAEWDKTKGEALDRVRPSYLGLLDTARTPG